MQIRKHKWTWIGHTLRILKIQEVPPDSGIPIENKPEEDPEIHRQGQQLRR